ncbi:NAD(P)/FAD-dependent oxidoreductase [Nocardiopsis algeriensis]|uniref:Glycine/D-amino acid oxidase-like deaminating enzyme n=1 Tax=Nocardiopsis algeriensis TaxID=1478215 RepID=A0A841IL34_9ACTN|nr:FAD-binding oxidoreductase [Nocardiopsis algeriensis]MBB6119373.1 glycine/D-amino acid oxidase-like deaminating enzyme [Nocardiopsis algeriensis]
MGLFTTAAQLRPIPRSTRFANGAVSFWFRETGVPERRDPLPGTVDYDVCIVGAGYTGLWTAYYLKKAQPDLRVAVVEREFAGYGASGRNGGWLSAEFAGSRERYAQSYGKASMIALQRAMMGTVDEVVSVAGAEGIDADIVKGGMRLVATNAAQRERLVEDIEYLQEWGYWPDDIHMLEEGHKPDIAVEGAVAAAYSPHAARVQPAKLVTGLARVVEALGVALFEGTAVEEIRPRQGASRPAVVTEHGTVYADHVIRATEGFTSALHGRRRDWQPMRSSMIATEPVPAEVWDKIGWEGREVLGDSAHSYVYAQRTADDRIAIGGRSVPHRLGSGEDGDGATQPQSIAELWRALTRMFPDVADVPVEHAWSGVLGVPRDGSPTVHLDTETGLGWAGGYIGSGVATSNLAGRTLRDLVLRRDTDLTRLPWVGHQSRGWEPEPLRWVGTQVVRGLYRSADRRESKIPEEKARTSRLAGIAGRLSGR